MTSTIGTRESLQRHLDWLYGPDGYSTSRGVPCRCSHAYKGLGVLYGVSMGKGWVRTTTHPDCPHHGTKAEAEWRQRHALKPRRESTGKKSNG